MYHVRSCYTKQVVIYHHCQDLKPGDILRKLQQEGIKATGRGIAKLLAKFIESVSVARKPLSGRPSKRNGLCNGTDRGTERNGTDRFTPFLGKRCRRATQMKRTGFRKILGHGLYTVQEDLLARTLFWRLAICSIFRQYLKRQQNIYGMTQLLISTFRCHSSK